MKNSLIEVLEEYETKRKRKTMNALDKVLEEYEVKNKKEENQLPIWKESDYALNDYINGSKDIQSLYNYYDLVDEGL